MTTGTTGSSTTVRVRHRARSQQSYDTDILDDSCDGGRVQLSDDPGVRLKQIAVAYGPEIAKNEGKRILADMVMAGVGPVNAGRRLDVSTQTIWKWQKEIDNEVGSFMKGKVDVKGFASKALSRLEHVIEKASAIAQSSSPTVSISNRLRALGEVRAATSDMISVMERFGALNGVHIDTGTSDEDPRAREVRALNDMFKGLDTELFGELNTAPEEEGT